ncbi:MAG: CDP-alcohol phosphatidyltransferase family protein [Deltaproteobacteria bacterium]|nr:CDP-alcohol phosphatidyltransferase family protein [Deltaproteobacteria bacterium]
MTLLERNLRLLHAVGVEKVLILHPPGDTIPPMIVPHRLGLELFGSEVEVPSADPLTILPALRFEVHKPFFFLEVNLLLDPRVLETLRQQPPPCFMVLGNGVYPPPWRVGWFAPEHLLLGNEIARNANRVSLRAVTVYDPELRGDAPPYCEKMSSESDLARGWRLLIDRVAKRPADLVEKYVDPPLENWLVRELCDTPVTPNQVTLLSIAVALAGASLFYQGWFFLAVFFAWVATVLDGVDGKLARVKLMTSRIGKLEHAADFFYENAWYLALAARLARTHDPAAWSVGLAITACDICDNIIGVLFAQLTGKTLDERAPFDQRFRLIGGRRSIYLLILLVGFLIGAPFSALQAVLGWAGVTVLIHLGRSAYHLLRR